MSNAKTLLIVDDCIEDREAYRRYLLTDPHQCYHILEADVAEDGLALCQTTHCDAILLDFCLPDMSGLEFLDELKQQVLQTAIPTIVLTGQGDEEIAVQAMKRGAKDYLVKQHLRPDVLQSAVRNAIEHSHLQRQLGQTTERQRLIATTALRIRQSLNLEEILNTAVAEVRNLLQCDRVLLCQLGAEGVSQSVAESVEPIWTQALGASMSRVDSPQKNRTADSQTTPQTIANVAKVRLSRSQRQVLERLQVQSLLEVPILVRHRGEGDRVDSPQLWGFLVAHQCSGVRTWLPEEVDLLHQLSVQLAIAIGQAELLTQTQIALQKEKELNALKSQIVATVSHEYRSPLTSILTAASTLKQHCDRLSADKQKWCLELIETKVRHLAKLVDDMLVANQLELNKTQFKPLPLDLLNFLADLLDDIRLQLSDRHELVFKVTGHPRGFWGDRNLLQQIFTNLLSNAIKYSPEGGKIECHLQSEETEVIFAIEDRGIGIPPADLAHLFESFQRASNVDTIPGTGLGLTITKACVELHGGTIALTSELGVGTQVTVTLPKRSQLKIKN
jgi:signal transduction histidine kinase